MSADSDGYVWDQTLDGGQFRGRVERTAPYRGTLTVTKADGTALLQAEVGIAYDAPFGPDVDDVALWQEMTVAAVDAHNSGDVG